jgi:hypothetical protein
LENRRKEIDECSTKKKKYIKLDQKLNFIILVEYHDRYSARKVIEYREMYLEKFHRKSMERNYSIGMLMDKMDL